MSTDATGRTLQQQGTPVTDALFREWTRVLRHKEMSNGALGNVAIVGIESMLAAAFEASAPARRVVLYQS
jgi:hypothetical protein